MAQFSHPLFQCPTFTLQPRRTFAALLPVASAATKSPASPHSSDPLLFLQWLPSPQSIQPKNQTSPQLAPSCLAPVCRPRPWSPPSALLVRTDQMFSLFIAAIFKVALPLLFIIALIDALTMTRTKRARVMRRSGDTYKTIASRLKVSPTTARRYCLA